MLYIKYLLNYHINDRHRTYTAPTRFNMPMCAVAHYMFAVISNDLCLSFALVLNITSNFIFISCSHLIWLAYQHASKSLALAIIIHKHKLWVNCNASRNEITANRYMWHLQLNWNENLMTFTSPDRTSDFTLKRWLFVLGIVPSPIVGEREL